MENSGIKFLKTKAQTELILMIATGGALELAILYFVCFDVDGLDYRKSTICYQYLLIGVNLLWRVLGGSQQRKVLFCRVPKIVDLLLYTSNWHHRHRIIYAFLLRG